jgi:hypothetical protein
MAHVLVEERALMLREVTGMTRANLKTYLQKYPAMVVKMFTEPVKSSKSVIMRMLGLSETEYVVGLAKIQSQTNNKPGTLFRGSLPLIVATLKDPNVVGLSQADLRSIFLYYPTLFTLSEGYLARRLRLLGSRGYTKEQLRHMLLTSPRSLLYDAGRYHRLQQFLRKKIGLSIEEICELTSKDTRLISASLNETIATKRAHLEEVWGLNQTSVRDLVLTHPTILTTPVETTAGLFNYLSKELGMTPAAVRSCVLQYPGFLRTNPLSLAQKLEYLVVFEVVLKALMLLLKHKGEASRQADVRDCNTSPLCKEEEEEEEEENEELIEAVETVLIKVATSVVLHIRIALTFSRTRIANRLTLAASSKYSSLYASNYHRNATQDDAKANQLSRDPDDKNVDLFMTALEDVTYHMRAREDGVWSTRMASPPWPEDKYTVAPASSEAKQRACVPRTATVSSSAAIAGSTGTGAESGSAVQAQRQESQIYKNLAAAIVSAVGARACRLLVQELQDIEKDGSQPTLSQLFLVAPQQAITYAESRFEKWLVSSRRGSASRV